jgi:HPr kinase/phosphorylase
METRFSPQDLYERYAKSLRLSWWGKRRGEALDILPQGRPAGGTTLIGHLNPIQPARIQVVGQRAIDYLNALGKNARNDTLQALTSGDSVLFIVADALSPPAALVAALEQARLPLLTSPLPVERLINDLDYYLKGILADATTVHGVFMEVLGIGVLLSGDSGIGKSELALELISRGQRLVADDAPLFHRTGPDTLRGSCPALLEDFLEVRGLGILNIRAMYGDNAVKRHKVLQLIVRLTCDEEHANGHDRLGVEQHSREMLGVMIDEVLLPVAPGRNLAVLVEAAVRNHILYTGGYRASDDFIQRHQALLKQDHS